MFSLAPFPLPIPLTGGTEHITIDRYGDTILTLHNPSINNTHIPNTFSYQVSSTVLQKTSFYSHDAFKKFWSETQRNADNKDHFICTDFDANALHTLLLAIHKEAFSWHEDCYYYTSAGLPTTVSTATLVEMMRIMDYYQMMQGSWIFARTAKMWFRAVETWMCVGVRGVSWRALVGRVEIVSWKTWRARGRCLGIVLGTWNSDLDSSLMRCGVRRTRGCESPLFTRLVDLGAAIRDCFCQRTVSSSDIVFVYLQMRLEEFSKTTRG